MSTVHEELIWLTVSKTHPDLLLAESTKYLLEEWLEDQRLPFTADNVSSAVVALGNQLPDKPKAKAPEPEPVEETPEQELRRLQKEYNSPNKDVAQAAKKRLKELANVNSQAAPRLPELPAEITAADIRNLGPNSLTALYCKYGSKQVIARLNGRA
jgi:hypothetical protein